MPCEENEDYKSRKPLSRLVDISVKQMGQKQSKQRKSAGDIVENPGEKKIPKSQNLMSVQVYS